MTASIISFVNFKGGVGKSALTVNLALAMAYFQSKKVLVIDLDIQSTTSIQLMTPEKWDNIANRNPSSTVYGLLMNQNPIGPCIVNIPLTKGRVKVSSIDLVPSCYKLKDFQQEKIPYQEPHYVVFWNQIMSCINSYDYILIDCPPNPYRTTECAVFSSEYIVVPCNLDEFSIMGLSLLAQEISSFKHTTQNLHAKFRKGYNQTEIRGIIINDLVLNEKAVNEKGVVALQKKIKELKFKNLLSINAEIIPPMPGKIPGHIRHSAAFKSSTYQHTPLILAKIPNKKGIVEDYKNLANEICQKL